MDYQFVLETQSEVAGAPDDYANLDPLLDGRSRFFRVLYDMTYGGSYPGGDPDTWAAVAAPADGATVYDISGHQNAAFRRGAGQTVTYAGGGFELNAVTTRGGGYLEIPAAVNADIYAPAPAGSDHVGESQAWAECHHFIWPNTATWTGQAAGSSPPIIHSTPGYYGSAAATERVWFGLALDGTANVIWQQSGGGTQGTNFIVLPIGNVVTNKHRGLLTQLLLWRKRDGTAGVRLKSSAGTDTPAPVAVAPDTANYSAVSSKIGVAPNTTWNANGLDLDASKFRLFRGWIGNLSRQDLDFFALADEDYADIMAIRAVNPGLYSPA